MCEDVYTDAIDADSSTVTRMKRSMHMHCEDNGEEYEYGDVEIHVVVQQQ